MRIRAFHFAILLLAAIASGQDDPWSTDPLDPEAIAQRRKELEKELQQPDKDASEEDRAWFAARAARVGLLADLEKAVRTYGGLASTEENGKRQAQAERELAALRDTDPGALPELRNSGDLAPIEEEARASAERDQAAREELERLRTAGREFEKDLQNAPTRAAELRAAIEKLADAKAGSVQAYRRVNAQAELRLWEFISRSAAETRKRIDAATRAAQAACDLTKLQVERTTKRLEAARIIVQKLAAREADETKKEAERLAAQAKRESDPLYKELTQIRAEVTRLRGESKNDESENSSLERERNQKKRTLARYERDYNRIEGRVESRRALAGAAADMLHSTLGTVKAERREIEESASRKNDARISRVLQSLAPLQDLEWELDGPVEDTPRWQKLAAEIPEARHAEALKQMEAALRGKDGLLAAVRTRLQTLERTHELLNEIDSLHDAQSKSLVRLESLITSHIYWARTDSRFGFELFAGALDDLTRLRGFYTESEFVGELADALGHDPLVYGSVALVMLVLLVGVTIAGRRIRARPVRRPRPGEHLRTGLRDASLTLLHAGAPPLVLFLAAALVVRIELPLRVAFPVQAGLRAVAFFLFVQRLTWGLLSKRGFLIVHFGVSRDVGKQIVRSVRIYTYAGMLLWIPRQLLAEADFDVADLQRVFGTSFRICELVAIALLLPRRLPVARAFVSGSEAGLRVLAVLNPLVFLALLLVAGMDLLGYRYGAIFFTERILATAVAVVVLRAVYAGLNQISGRVTERVRERAFREQGGTAAWEDSSLVTKQLTRLITVGVIVAAAVLLGRAWNLGTAPGSILRGWQLAELSDGVVLTASDIATALLFVLGAHFLASNIAGLFELIVFPIFGKVHRGTRFVVLALSRYAVLLLGYSAALLAVHFSISNLGWLLAAASVGLGFGLQEIVANFVSGLILLVEQPVRVGDVITVGDSGGTVEKITIRSTVVTNWDQQQIIIPNKNFITQNLTNWSRNSSFTRRRIPVSLSYGSDVEKAFTVLESAVKEVENVRAYPPPRILFDGFGESGLEFMIWIYVDIDVGLTTMTEVRRHVFRRLKEEGITIPFPQRDLHIKRDDLADLKSAAAAEQERDTSPEATS